MVKKTGIILLVSLTLLCSCKFDQNLNGSYTGSYYSLIGLPVDQGTGTLVVTQTDDTHIDAVFHSAGNPDIFVTNIQVDKRSVVGAYYWECQEEAASSYQFLLQTNTNTWEFYGYYDDATLNVTFQGAREH